MLKRVLEEARHAARLRALSSDAGTREKILDAAENLLQRRGFNAFSYNHIAVQLGLRHAAIHYHFPGKADLGVALVQSYRERFARWHRDVDARYEDAWLRLQAYFGIGVDYLNHDNQVCPVGVLGNDFQSLPQPMRRESRLLLEEVYGWLGATLAYGRDQGQLVFDGSAENKAFALGAALQGALQLDRISDRAVFHRVIEQLEVEVRAPRVNGN